MNVDIGHPNLKNNRWHRERSWGPRRASGSTSKWTPPKAGWGAWRPRR